MTRLAIWECVRLQLHMCIVRNSFLKLRTCPNENIVRAVGVGIVVLCDVRLPRSDKGYCSMLAYVEVMVVV